MDILRLTVFIWEHFVETLQLEDNLQLTFQLLSSLPPFLKLHSKALNSKAILLFPPVFSQDWVHNLFCFEVSSFSYVGRAESPQTEAPCTPSGSCTVWDTGKWTPETSGDDFLLFLLTEFKPLASLLLSLLVSCWLQLNLIAFSLNFCCCCCFIA